MNVLSMGLPFGAGQAPVQLFHSQRGHTVRTLAADGTGDFDFEAGETAADVVARVAQDWQPDVLLCWLPEMYPPPLCVEECPIKTVAAVSDWNVYYAQLEHNLSRYDVVLTDRLGAESIRFPGAMPRYFQPMYSQNTLFHKKIPEVEKDLDVVFVGNLNPVVHHDRARCMERIAGLAGRYRILFATNHWDEAYARLLNRARIVFNHSIRREMNLRCFETLACGSLLFLEEDNLEVGDWLRDRGEVVLYTAENLVELVEHYLGQPDEAERIAQQGHEKAEALAGENRLDALLDWLEEQPMGERAFRELPEEERALAEVMQYASSLVAAQRAHAEAVLAEAARHYPNKPEFRLAAGSVLLDKLVAGIDEDRAGMTRSMLEHFYRACSLAPEAGVTWLDLAFACRLADAPDPEMRCLEKVLTTTSCACGGLLLGSTSDPYYVAWRKAVAVGEARQEILQAAAARRLAELRLGRGELDDAVAYAQHSIDWLPGIPAPHRTLAKALVEQGDVSAAKEALEASLPLSAFDADHRKEVISAYTACGMQDEARGLAEESARLFSVFEDKEDVADSFVRLTQ